MNELALKEYEKKVWGMLPKPIDFLISLIASSFLYGWILSYILGMDFYFIVRIVGFVMALLVAMIPNARLPLNLKIFSRVFSAKSGVGIVAENTNTK